jgi:hypothetical protein
MRGDISTSVQRKQNVRIDSVGCVYTISRILVAMEFAVTAGLIDPA